MKPLNILKYIVLVFLIGILTSFLIWYVQDKTAINLYILDKTVPSESGSGHQSLDWVLNFNRVTKPDLKPYSVHKDYYGYFRQPGEKEYSVRGLRLSEILSVVDDIDMAYYTDTYSFSGNSDDVNTLSDSSTLKHLYGGLNQNDFLLLSELRRKKKLILTEYNLFDFPTSDLIRQKTGDLFDLKSSGWKGVYIKDFGQIKKELPGWIVKLFEKKYAEIKGSGLLFIKANEVVVLDEKTYLTAPFPIIKTGDYGQKKYQLPESQYFTGWFDVVKSGASNKEVAFFHLPLNAEGEKLLKKSGIPSEFPAILEHLKYYKYYYFSGDFSNCTVNGVTSQFKGMVWLGQLLSSEEVGSQKAFFWRYYYPLITNIMNYNLIRNQ